MTPLEKLLQQVQRLNKEKKYDEVIKLLPDTVLEEHKSADLYAEKTEAYWEVKENILCNEVAEKALSIDPYHPKALYYQGIFMPI